jgi:hypothetical protein
VSHGVVLITLAQFLHQNLPDLAHVLAILTHLLAAFAADLSVFFRGKCGKADFSFLGHFFRFDLCWHIKFLCVTNNLPIPDL